MSATNRGTKRAPQDFYATPINVIKTFLDAYDRFSPGDVILEPSAGRGNFVQCLRERYEGIKIHACELQTENAKTLFPFADLVMQGDYLASEFPCRYDIIIGNPPYSLAQEFVDKSLSLLKEDGCLIFLLRAAFLESKKRFVWWQDKLPSGLYVLNERPSFTGKGTDATAYAWFIWDRKKSGQEIQVV